MKVIFLKDVRKVGRRFEEKEVSDGFARNMLIPQGLAVPIGSPEARKVLEEKKNEGIKKAREGDKLHQHIAELSKAPIVIKARSNEKGHLFEKITAKKLSILLRKERGVDIGEDNLIIDTLKEVGTHEIPIKIDDKETKFVLEIKPEEHA